MVPLPRPDELCLVAAQVNNDTREPEEGAEPSEQDWFDWTDRRMSRVLPMEWIEQ